MMQIQEFKIWITCDKKIEASGLFANLALNSNFNIEALEVKEIIRDDENE